MRRNASDSDDVLSRRVFFALHHVTLDPQPLGQALEALTLMAVWWTKTSFSPSLHVKNPYPWLSLNHFTLPVVGISSLHFDYSSEFGAARAADYCPDAQMHCTVLASHVRCRSSRRTEHLCAGEGGNRLLATNCQ